MVDLNILEIEIGLRVRGERGPFFLFRFTAYTELDGTARIENIIYVISVGELWVYARLM